ncbi:MAG TPA: 4-hydroxy-2-oxo-heptane-1,7-dioate aldolase, partial [Candidatus Latescibacteria bacterium]|nr:4-hydroxy-2-oxo-heptane-1,7-dioate aldolase [Candidatus Latescibacterota bacterium]
EADSEILTVVLIEEIRAVENLDAILEVDDIDVFFVAPGDLAQTMGIVGDFSHPELQRVVDKSLNRIVAAGRTAGALGVDANLERYLDMGVRFFLTVYDPWIKQGAEALLSRIAERVE